ncbi:MAG: hypothetical protein IPP74_14265 [Alphaproteobacteria bacterium]|nr:hypothetical protein [Alphaproteobacteria bacterium]
MSDFIKINFENGGHAILNKNQFYLRYIAEFEEYYIYSIAVVSNEMNRIIRDCVENILAVLASIYEKYNVRKNIDECVDNLSSSLYDYWDSCQITKEEYNRLCKELGVE